MIRLAQDWQQADGGACLIFPHQYDHFLAVG